MLSQCTGVYAGLDWCMLVYTSEKLAYTSLYKYILVYTNVY
jgi:hypothetical protein